MHRLTTMLTGQTSRPRPIHRHADGRLCSHPQTCGRDHVVPKRRADDVCMSTVQTGGAHRGEAR